MAGDNKKGEEKDEKKGSKIIIILLAAIIVILVAAGAVYFFVFAKKGAATTNTANNANAVNQVQQNSNGMVTTVDVDEQTYTFTEITTNLADKDSEKFIKTDVALGYDPSTNKKLQSELESKDAIKTPILRAEIVQVLRSKAAADFSDDKKVDEIKKEILNRVNMHLKNGRVSNIYFSNLVIQ
jgi:flagellar basal body-associated protein FliL